MFDNNALYLMDQSINISNTIYIRCPTNVHVAVNEGKIGKKKIINAYFFCLFATRRN